MPRRGDVVPQPPLRQLPPLADLLDEARRQRPFRIGRLISGWTEHRQERDAERRPDGKEIHDPAPPDDVPGLLLRRGAPAGHLTRFVRIVGRLEYLAVGSDDGVRLGQDDRRIGFRRRSDPREDTLVDLRALDGYAVRDERLMRRGLYR